MGDKVKAEFNIGLSEGLGRGELDLSGLALTNTDLVELMPLIQRALPDLKVLNLDDNKLSELPPELGNFTALTALSVERNELTGVPEEISKLEKLEFLNLKNNRLTNMPNGIWIIENLKSPDLNNNPLSRETWDSWFNTWENREKAEFRIGYAEALGQGELDLSGLGLTNTDLVEQVPLIKRMQPSLKILNLNNNKLSELPPELGDFTELTALSAENNELTGVSEEISKLEKLEFLNLIDNRLTTFPEGIRELQSLESFYAKGNPLSAQTMIFLNRTFGNRAKFNRAPFELNTHGKRVLRKIYGKKETKVIASKINALDMTGPFRDGEGKILNAQQVAYSVLSKVPHRKANKMYFEAVKDLLAPVLNESSSAEEKEDKLHVMAFALGNCATPVLDLLVQAYIGKYKDESQEDRPKNYDALVAREALEKEIDSKLANATNEAGVDIMPNLEKIEQVQGLTNAVFLRGGRSIPFNKVKIVFPKGEKPRRLPGKTADTRFSFKEVSPVLATAFAKLVCRTNADGALETNAKGHYVFDPQKMERIVNKYKNALGDTSIREALVGKYQEDIKGVLELNDELYLFFDKEEVANLYKLPEQQEDLRERLNEVSDEEVTREYEKFVEEKTAKIAAVLIQYTDKEIILPEKGQTQGETSDFLRLTTPKNEEQRSHRTSQTATGASSSRLGRSTSRGRGI